MKKNLGVLTAVITLLAAFVVAIGGLVYKMSMPDPKIFVVNADQARLNEVLGPCPEGREIVAWDSQGNLRSSLPGGDELRASDGDDAWTVASFLCGANYEAIPSSFVGRPAVEIGLSAELGGKENRGVVCWDPSLAPEQCHDERFVRVLFQAGAHEPVSCPAGAL
jgi:hypothetical protein